MLIHYPSCKSRKNYVLRGENIDIVRPLTIFFLIVLNKPRRCYSVILLSLITCWTSFIKIVHNMCDKTKF